MTANCPSNLELHQHVLEPELSPLTAHLSDCAVCAQRVSQIEADRARFDAFIFPATVDSVVRQSARRPTRRRWLWLAPVPAFTAFALMFTHPARHEDITRRRGGRFSWVVFASSPHGLRPVTDGDHIPADATLRFEVHPTEPCWVSVVSVDVTGQVSKLFPADGESMELRQPGVLPGGAVLDGVPGPERLFVLCAPTALTLDSIRNDGLFRAMTDDGVRQLRDIPGVDSRTEQTTVLLEKDSPVTTPAR